MDAAEFIRTASVVLGMLSILAGVFIWVMRVQIQSALSPVMLALQAAHHRLEDHGRRIDAVEKSVSDKASRSDVELLVTVGLAKYNGHHE